MRNIVRSLAENRIVFSFVRLILAVNSGFAWLASHLKMRSVISEVGRKTFCHWTVELKYGENISIGFHSSVGPYSCIGARSRVSIGSYVRISRGVVIETASLDLKSPPPYPHISKPITIEDGVWIASNAIILGGVTIGANAIIGAGAVVSKDVPPGSIIVGQPVRQILKQGS